MVKGILVAMALLVPQIAFSSEAYVRQVSVGSATVTLELLATQTNLMVPNLPGIPAILQSGLWSSQRSVAVRGSTAMIMQIGFNNSAVIIQR